jgi:hypothetical protein
MSTPQDILAMAELAGVNVETVRPAARKIRALSVTSGGSSTSSFDLQRPGTLFVITRIELEGYPKDAANNPIFSARLGNPGNPYANAFQLTITDNSDSATPATDIAAHNGDTFIVLRSGTYELEFSLNNNFIAIGTVVVLWGRLFGFQVPEQAAERLSQHEMVIL